MLLTRSFAWGCLGGWRTIPSASISSETATQSQFFVNLFGAKISWERDLNLGRSTWNLDSKFVVPHLQDVIPKVKRSAWLPLSGILKELVEIVPVALQCVCSRSRGSEEFLACLRVEVVRVQLVPTCEALHLTTWVSSAVQVGATESECLSPICRNISNTCFPASRFKIFPKYFQNVSKIFPSPLSPPPASKIFPKYVQNISQIFPNYYQNISITSFSASSFQKGRRSMKKEGLRAKKITMSNKSFLTVKESVNIVNSRDIDKTFV